MLGESREEGRKRRSKARRPLHCQDCKASEWKWIEDKGQRFWELACPIKGEVPATGYACDNFERRK